MKYVKHLNEQWFEDLLSDYIGAFQKIYYKLSAFDANIAPYQEEIKPTPVTVGDKEFPFPLAAKLYPIYQWLIGEAAKPSDIEQTLDEIYHLVWFNPFVDYSEPVEEALVMDKWTGPMGAHTGQFYRFAKIAITLENDESINATDLAMLLNVTTMAVSKQIREGKIEAIKYKGEWVIKSEDAKNWITNKVEKEKSSVEPQISQHTLKKFESKESTLKAKNKSNDYNGW